MDRIRASSIVTGAPDLEATCHPHQGDPSGTGAIRVLIVDDSALVRKILTEQLDRYEDISIVGSAVDATIARAKIRTLRPDVITLDLQLPGTDGLAFLETLMQEAPLPVVVVSSFAQENSETAIRALHLGAIAVVSKPGSPLSTPDVDRQLVRSIREAAAVRFPSRSTQAPPSARPAAVTPPRPPRLPYAAPAALVRRPAIQAQSLGAPVIAVGASTGGAKAIETLLTGLPADAPGVLVVQHLAAGFTRALAERLDRVCAITVREARQDDEVVPGQALIAPGGRHLLLRRDGARHVVHVKDGPLVQYHRPSVDVLFDSVATAAGADAIGVLLTGMGGDGARGLLAMHRQGAYTLAQDEETSVVFGMPREAIKLGAVDAIVPLPDLPAAILGALAF